MSIVGDIKAAADGSLSVTGTVNVGTGITLGETLTTSTQLTGTAAALGRITLGSMKNVWFTITASGGETISVTAYLDSAESLETAALRPIDLNTGALNGATALATGSYQLKDICAYSLKFTKSAAVQTGTVNAYLKAV